MRYQPIEERFATKWVEDPATGCWVWQGARIAGGYGSLRLPRNTGAILAHRFSYEHHVGPVPAGAFVMHRCDTPACVNPEHLRLGTHDDNMRDMAEKGRARVPRGPRTRLTDADRSRMKEQVSAGIPIKRVAADFGVDRRIVRKICGPSQAKTSTGKSWSN